MQKKIEFKSKVYLLKDFLELVKGKKERSTSYDAAYCYSVYSKSGDVGLLDEVYIGDVVEVDDDDQEICPEFVVENGFEYYCSDENIQDVVDYAFEKNKELSAQFLLDSLVYYIEKDTFLN